MKWIAMIAVSLVWTAQAFAEDGNYLLGPPENNPAETEPPESPSSSSPAGDASAINVDKWIREIEHMGIPIIGMSKAAVTEALRRESRDSNTAWGDRNTRRMVKQATRGDCEPLADDKELCGYRYWRYPFMIFYHNDEAYAVTVFHGEGAEALQELESWARSAAEVSKPSESAADYMTWTGDSMTLGINWDGRGVMSWGYMSP